MTRPLRFAAKLWTRRCVLRTHGTPCRQIARAVPSVVLKSQWSMEQHGQRVHLETRLLISASNFGLRLLRLRMLKQASACVRQILWETRCPKLFSGTRKVIFTMRGIASPQVGLISEISNLNHPFLFFLYSHGMRSL